MERSEKKSNKRVIAIAALLLALIILFAFGGYTMSKYMSSRSVDGKAEVAKWGYTVNANATKLFGKKWQDGKIMTGDPATGTLIDVQASTDVIAPGTSGEVTFGIEGSAEVLAKITVKMDKYAEADTDVKDVKLKAKLSDEDATTTDVDVEYAPIKWTLTATTKTTADDTNPTEEKTAGTLAEIKAALNDDFNGTIKEIGQYVNVQYKLAWVWEFEDNQVSPTCTDTEITANHCDTMLGSIAAGKTAGDTYTAINPHWTNNGSVTTIAFKLSISVVQVQDQNKSN